MIFETGSLGALIIRAEDAFIEHCNEYQLRNPNYEEIKIWQKYNKQKTKEDGSSLIPIIFEQDYSKEDKQKLKELREEKERYDKTKDCYILQYILKNGTYDNCIEYCKLSHKEYLLDLIKAFPCDGIDKQCSLLCPRYEDCPKEGE